MSVPVLGGDGICEVRSHPGTAGCLAAFTDDPQRVLMLTAQHVVVPANAQGGEVIEGDGEPPAGFGFIGRLFAWTGLDGSTTTDAALVWVDPQLVGADIRGLGPPQGTNTSPSVGDSLFMRGAASKTKRSGQILAIGEDVPIVVGGPDWSQTLTYRNQILCKQFDTGGDSGAIALDANGRAVGMVVAGIMGSDGMLTVVTPIHAVLTHQTWRGRTLDLLSTVTPGAIAPAGPSGPPGVEIAPATAVSSTADPAAAVEVLARTLWAEDRSGGIEGMTAVAAVIINRVRARRTTQWGATVEEVCKKPKQFSCWTPGGANHDAMLRADQTDASFRTALDIARDAIEGRLVDPTGGATHYVTTALFQQECNRAQPANRWYCETAAADRTTIVDQIFFRKVS